MKYGQQHIYITSHLQLVNTVEDMYVHIVRNQVMSDVEH